MTDKTKTFADKQIRKDLPEVRIGDTIKLYNKFTEKGKERVQRFEGTVISKKGSGISTNMTLRGLTSGAMMEKTIPVHSPNIDKIELVKRGKVRRSKLYYLRDVVGKKAKLKRKEEKPREDKIDESSDNS